MKKKRTTKRPGPKTTKKRSRKRHVPVKTHRRASNTVRRTTRKGKRKDTRKSIPRAIRLMRRQGLSLAKAARTVGVSPRTVHRVAGSALRKQPNERYVARRRDRLVRVVYVLTNDGIQEASLKGSEQATLVGEHWNAVHAHVARGDAADLGRFHGLQVTDVNGTQFHLTSDLVAINEMANAGVLSFETIYARTR
jgi:hypothetical protein